MGAPLTQLLGKKNPDQATATKKTSTLSLNDNSTSIGVEIEMENLSTNYMNRGNIAGWERKSDGSLRGSSREFVFSQPLRGDAVIAALESLSENFEDEKFEKHKNLRTSMHVHINMLSLDRYQLNAVIIAALLADDAVFRQTEQNRQYLGYSRKSEDALITTISRLFSDPSDAVIGNMNAHGRYYSMNTAAISKYGTLEFRHFSTPNDIEEAVRMINLCLDVKKCGMQAWEAAATDEARNDPETMYHLVRAQVEAVFGNEHEMLAVEQFLSKLELATAEYEYSPHTSQLDAELQYALSLEPLLQEERSVVEEGPRDQDIVDELISRMVARRPISQQEVDSLVNMLYRSNEPLLITVDMWQAVRRSNAYRSSGLTGHIIRVEGNNNGILYYIIEGDFVGNSMRTIDEALASGRNGRYEARRRQLMPPIAAVTEQTRAPYDVVTGRLIF